MVIAITHYARIAIAQVFLRGYVLQNEGGVSMLLYASAGEAFRGEKGQLVYTKTDLKKKKKKEAQLGCSQKMLDNTEIFRSCYTHP